MPESRELYSSLSPASQTTICVCLYASSTDLNDVLEHRVQRNTTLLFVPAVIGNLILWFGKKAMSTLPLVEKEVQRNSELSASMLSNRRCFLSALVPVCVVCVQGD